jgi:hypothetical protein
MRVQRGIGLVIQVPATTPLDPLQRRDEWQVAVLIVALVVAGMQDPAGASASVRPSFSPSSLPVGGIPARRLVRPPRSC